MYQAEKAALCEDTEPGVISGNILLSLAIEQGPKNEAGRLFLKDEIELSKLKEIRIEFLNILNIDYVWVLKDLVKLSLSHNVIEIIENLDELVHLKELDLSFNRIKVMQNLNHLHQLEVLILYNNEISVIQGIDNLKKLTILNIGRNKVADWEHVMYLRELKSLRSLNMCDNPCIEINGYLDYLFAFIPQLLYYQYKIISEDARESAINKHHHELLKIEEKEAKVQEQLRIKQEYEDKIALLSLSYVEYLDEDSLFQKMFLFDESGKTLSMINEDAEDIFEIYKKSFCAICNELYEIGLQEHKKRLEEIQLFKKAVNGGKETTQNEARNYVRIIDEILEKKDKIFVDIKNLMEGLAEETEETNENKAMKTVELIDEFNELLSTVRTQLISKEVLLHDQIEDINEVFKYNISDMVSSFIDNARIYFSNLRNAEAEYNDSIEGVVLYYLSSLEDEALMPKHLLDICGSKDILSITLTASHDLHLQTIDEREESLANRLNDWLENYINQLIIDENKRNRQQILEISHFFGFQKEELSAVGLPQPAHLADIDLDIDDLNI